MGSVTYNGLGTMGRLGNQMFQIAATIGAAIDNDLDYYFKDWKCGYTHSDFNEFMKNKLKNDPTGNSEVQYQEPGFSYSKINLNPNLNYGLRGYFQSEKYFKNHKDLILKTFELSDDFKNVLRSKYGKILSNSCSLHVRRGDYVSKQDYHPLVPLDYYQRALNEIYGDDLTSVNILVFSDDIKWCKENIKINDTNINYITNNIDILDLYLMTMCDNNIIANSSFSWWGAWLNENENKKIIAPKTWFGTKQTNLQTNDLYCKGWIQI